MYSFVLYADRNMRMITQSNKDKLNIVRILIQCSLNKSRFHTCKVPGRGDMTTFVNVALSTQCTIDKYVVRVDIRRRQSNRLYSCSCSYPYPYPRIRIRHAACPVVTGMAIEASSVPAGLPGRRDFVIRLAALQFYFFYVVVFFFNYSHH